MKAYNKHILIVDDNLVNLQVTTRILKKEGYMISLAQSGMSALKGLENQVPDLILLDIMMPEMDGYEVCRKIKECERFANIPVIFLTAKTQTEDLVDAFNYGGVDYITKPFHTEELLARVKTHTDLSIARRRIEDMNKTRDKLYSIIAHDIKTPFSNIILTIEAIKNNYVDPSSDLFKELLEKLDENTKSTFSLLKNLLTWTRLQGESVELALGEFSVYELVNDCQLLLKPSADKKDISLINTISENEKAYFDEITMHAVFRNVISNAIKFTPKGGVIKISLSQEDGFKKVIVRDNGVGISDEDLKKIFEHNMVLTTPGTNNESGTGLGYIMIKDFVSKNNGKITVSSKPKEGTEVAIFLPEYQNEFTL